MAKIDSKIPIIPLSSVADILNVKQRTLRMYEEKALLPRYEGIDKKLYSIDDIKIIEIVHYLATIKKINANGIKFILSIYNNIFTDIERENLSNEAEKFIKQESFEDSNFEYNL